MAIPALPKSAVDEENALSIVGIDKAALESLIASGVFAPPPNGVWLPKDIRKLRCLLEHLLTIDEAAESLGVSHDALSDFVSAKLLVPMHGPLVDGRRRTFFSAFDIEKILDKASQIVKPQDVTNGHCAAVNYEVQITNAEILTAFLSGILPCSSIDSAALGLSQYRFARKLVNGLNHLNAVPSGFVTVKQVCEEGWLYPDALRSLCLHDWIVAKKSRANNACLVSEVSLKEFRAKYVTASELGVLHKLSSRIIPARLRSVGVKPVGGPELDGTIIYIFERSKVAGVSLGNIRLTKAEFEKASKAAQSNCRDYAQGFVSLKQTMKILNFSKHEVSELEKRGFLKRVKLQGRMGREVYYAEQSVSDFCSDIVKSEKYMSYAEMISVLKCKRYQQVLQRWVARKLLTPFDTGFSKLFLKSEVEACRRDAEEFLTMSEAAKFLNVKRETLDSMLFRGNIFAAHGPAIDGLKIYLFSKGELLRLLEMRLGGFLVAVCGPG